MSRIRKSFYLREDTLSLARELIGKIIVSKTEGILTSGIISETEAYLGTGDRASHAYNHRLTKRTSVMYREGGISYVYLCYGVHHLLNVVTGPKGIPHAILLRSIIPETGIKTMLKRRGINTAKTWTGPGNLTRALGIDLRHNRLSLTGRQLWLEENLSFPAMKISTTPRIGIDYAGEDALLPYRFVLDK